MRSWYIVMNGFLFENIEEMYRLFTHIQQILRMMRRNIERNVFRYDEITVIDVLVCLV